jgi:hypothetical protein
LNAHPCLVNVPDNPFEGDILVSGLQCEHNLRSDRKGIGVNDENALEAKVSDDRAGQAVNHTIDRLGLKSLSGASIFSGRHNYPSGNDGIALYRRNDRFLEYTSTGRGSNTDGN